MAILRRISILILANLGVACGGEAQPAATEATPLPQDREPVDQTEAPRSFKPSGLFAPGESSCDRLDERPTQCTWLRAVDAVAIGTVVSVDAVRVPSFSNYGRGETPLSYNESNSCPGEVYPAVDVVLENVVWATGSGPGTATIRIASGILALWSPGLLLDGNEDPYWASERGITVGSTIGVGANQLTLGKESLWTMTEIPPFTFSKEGLVLHAQDGSCGLRYPDGFAGTAYANLLEAAGNCGNEPDDVAAAFHADYLAQQVQPVNRYGARCAWDEAPPSCSEDACPGGMECTSDKYCIVAH